MSLSDRRHQPRFPFHSRATIRRDGLEDVGMLLDISLSGGLFSGVLDKPARVGDQCTLGIFHGARPALALPGVVIHVHGHLIGVEFTVVDDGVFETLRNIIELNLGTPQLLSRDIAALLR